MSSYDAFREVMNELGWDYDRLNDIWRDRERQPIDRQKVLAALPDATLDELKAWGKEFHEEIIAQIVEEENLLSIGGPHDMRLRQLKRAEVAYDGGPFDGEVVLTRFEPKRGKRETEAESFAYSLCLQAADGEGGQALVGHRQTRMAVDFREAVGRDQTFSHEYQVDSVHDDGKTMRIVCTFVRTWAGLRNT